MKSKWEDIPPIVRELMINEQLVQTGTSNPNRLKNNSTAMGFSGVGGFSWINCSLGRLGTQPSIYYSAWSNAILNQNYTALERIYSIKIDKKCTEVEIEGEKFMV